MFYKSARVEYHPVGVVGAIVPWNYPFHNIFNPLTAALFAGNAIVIKVGALLGEAGRGRERWDRPRHPARPRPPAGVGARVLVGPVLPPHHRRRPRGG
jgi:hypothetical protein